MFALDSIQLYIFYICFILGLLGNVQTEIKTVRGTEGETVTLTTSLSGLQDESIAWTIIGGPVNAETTIFTNFPIKTMEFDKRLHLDAQSGSLTIENLKTNDNGIYKIQKMTGNFITQTFNLTVYAPVSAPDIRNVSQSHSQVRSLEGNSCRVECCVKNGKETSL
ncbi:hypothetical protein DPEC_G00377000 [Dallia pectoralis]|nr:hypothetical protein DPEC_G00377000 [Dallia pectoralis]